MRRKFTFGWIAMSVLALASCSKTDPGKTPGVPDGTPTTARITLSQTGLQSKANDPNGTAEEGKVSNATLYVFANKTLASVVTFDANSETKMFATTTGPKQLFACVNMNAKLAGLNIAPGMELSVFKKKIQKVESLQEFKDNVTKANEFWMTNLENDAPVVTVEKATDQDVTDGLQNNFTIKVGRVCAKVDLSLSGAVTQEGGQLEDISYKVCNNPKEMYLMPVYAGPNYEQPDLLTPNYDKEFATDVTPGKVTAADYFQTDAILLSASSHISYMAENSNKPVYMSKATYLEVKGIWTPNADQIRDGGTINKGTTFYRIAQMDGQSHITGYKPGVYATQPSVGTNEKVVTYTDGVCYYGIWIADNKITIPSLKYTVKRNTYFKVSIDDISGPGAGEPGDVTPDPSKPVEETVNMKATIDVQPWTVVEQHAGI